jgi:glycosyltransferase involved in cell wall biosynthesis
MNALLISVLVCARNPRPEYLARTLGALRAQTLPFPFWELLVVDNASTPPLPPAAGLPGHPGARVVREPRLGLTPARLRGIAEAQAPLLVFVDDDNVLAADYLACAVRLFAEQPHLGAAGGPVLPEWETVPPEWTRSFHGLLALRDLGPGIRVCKGGPGVGWPDFAPVGAGLVARRMAAQAYALALEHDTDRQALDRSGESLASGGDNDLVFSILHGGGDVGYFPELRLTHLIPEARLRTGYLTRLNAGIMRTWVLVLHLHGQCPWPAIPPWTVPLRCARAWLRTRAWSSPARRVRWSGNCGQFRGQALIRNSSRRR